ncbi:MAG TPA: hypothetical protein DHV55_00515 [Clostridiaceae bacterium]|nr:hypothetical protein [Clostridiaceae bacterium]
MHNNPPKMFKYFHNDVNTISYILQYIYCILQNVKCHCLVYLFMLKYAVKTRRIKCRRINNRKVREHSHDRYY